MTEQTPPASEEDVRLLVKNLLHDELGHFLSDIERRLGQNREIERSIAATVGEGEPFQRSVHAEDINSSMHMIDGYTVTANSPVAGSIAWTNVHVVYNGVDYTATNANTAFKYTWFVKPGSGTAVTLNSSNTKPVLATGDTMIFLNNAGTPISALETSTPTLLPDGIVGTNEIASGAITPDRTSFYTALNTAITNAQTSADLAQATADGSVTTFFQANAPWANGDATAGGSSNPAARVGDIWYDSDDGQAYRWSGASGTPANTWVMIEDNSIAAALAAANAAQGTANSRITTFYANLAAVPTALAVGDLWVVIDQGNQLRRATATGTGSWVTIQMGTAAIADSAITDVKVGTGINGTKLSTGTVGSVQLGSGAVTPVKLNTLQHVLY